MIGVSRELLVECTKPKIDSDTIINIPRDNVSLQIIKKQKVINFLEFWKSSDSYSEYDPVSHNRVISSMRTKVQVLEQFKEWSDIEISNNYFFQIWKDNVKNLSRFTFCLILLLTYFSLKLLVRS